MRQRCEALRGQGRGTAIRLAAVVERSGVSRAELLASLSLAVDLGLGLPVEHVLRQTVIATRLAESAGFERVDREPRSTSRCSRGLAARRTRLSSPGSSGTTSASAADSYDADLAGLPLLWFMVRNVGSGGSSLRRCRVAVGDPDQRRGRAQLRRGPRLRRPSRGSARARQGRRRRARSAVRALGRQRRAEEAARRAARRRLSVCCTSPTSSRSTSGLGGHAAALAVATERAGAAFDPDLVDRLVAHHGEVLAGLDESSWDEVIAADPAMGAAIGDDELP